MNKLGDIDPHAIPAPMNVRSVDVHVHRASMTAGQEIPLTRITINASIDEVVPTQDRRDQVEVPLWKAMEPVYDGEAEAIAQALHNALPGGTFDRLVAKLLLIKASHFRVRWPE